MVLTSGFDYEIWPPTPHKFGFGILKVVDSLVRICGERGSHRVFFFALFSEVSTFGLPAQWHSLRMFRGSVPPSGRSG